VRYCRSKVAALQRQPAGSVVVAFTCTARFCSMASATCCLASRGAPWSAPKAAGGSSRSQPGRRLFCEASGSKDPSSNPNYRRSSSSDRSKDPNYRRQSSNDYWQVCRAAAAAAIATALLKTAARACRSAPRCSLPLPLPFSSFLPICRNPSRRKRVDTGKSSKGPSVDGEKR